MNGAFQAIANDWLGDEGNQILDESVVRSMRMRTQSSPALPRSFHEYRSDAVEDEVKNMYFEKRTKSLPDQLRRGHRSQA